MISDPSSLADLTPEERDRALVRFTALRPHLDDGVPLRALTTSAGWSELADVATVGGTVSPPRADGVGPRSTPGQGATPPASRPAVAHRGSRATSPAADHRHDRPSGRRGRGRTRLGRTRIHDCPRHRPGNRPSDGDSCSRGGSGCSIVIRSLFELRDLGKLKLFFADTLEPADALDLITALHRRSEDLLVRLHRESEPGARLLDENGVRFPMLTLRLGLAFHAAMASACEEFERELANPNNAQGRLIPHSRDRFITHCSAACAIDATG